MNQVNYAERRQFFRLRYPFADRPRLIVQHKVYELTEISEGGLRFSSKQAAQFPLAQFLTVTLSLHGGKTVDVEGHTLRIERDEVIMQLTLGIPGRVVVDEQRYLIRKYRHT